MVEKPHRAQITMNDPYEGVRDDYRSYFTHVPGVLFFMPLGTAVDESVRSLSISATGNPINVSEGLTKSFEELMVKTVRESRRTHAYLRAKALADVTRGPKS